MRFTARLRRFARETRGLAAVEFALIAPMMVFLLFGAVELIDALDVDQRVQNAASSLADVVSRDTEVSNTELNGLWSALDILMYPDSSSSMSACITSISIDSSGTAHTQWHEQHNGFGTCPSNSVSLSSSMLQPNSSLIVAETHYNYTPRLNFVFNGAFQMSHVVYRRSRIVDPIPRVS
ncbi:MAG TPA: TadE/TadG family type IV pilus assembly protein [Caulobacterales bacterium]|nr:TadE/TadG family type IV pilus assembly protein [Caulobacterales bacterium]